MFGEAISLACVGFGVPFAEISWSINGAVLLNSTDVIIYEEEITRGGRIFKQSFLELCSVITSAYTCSITNGKTMINTSTLLSVLGTYVQYNVHMQYVPTLLFSLLL